MKRKYKVSLTCNGINKTSEVSSVIDALKALMCVACCGAVVSNVTIYKYGK